MTYIPKLQGLAPDNYVRVWKHGEFPMPDWIPPLMVKGIEANGTFVISTDFGNARVHPGSVVIERAGKAWVQPLDDAATFIENLTPISASPITNIGPGKARQYGHPGKVKPKPSGISATGPPQRRRFASLTGAQPTIEWIHTDKLSVDQSYQRSTDNEASHRLIATIASRFDWRLCTPLIVSRRPNDSLVIIDGQHRWMAACLRDDLPQLPCCIFRYENTAEEARMFVVANRARKPMNRLDDYFAAIAASDEDAMEIQQIVNQAGLSVARSTAAGSWQPGEVAFTSAIAHAIRRHDVKIPSAVLTNMAVAFPNQKFLHGGAIFLALVRIMAKPPEGFDPDRLVCALETKTMSEWGGHVSGINGSDARANAFFDAILATYEGLSDEAENAPMLELISA